MTTKTSGNHEPGYKPVLVREETKERLRGLRAELGERDLFQERRLATAALELALEAALASDEGLNRLLTRTREVVVRDVNSASA